MNKGNIHSKTLARYLQRKKFRFDFLGLNLRAVLLVILQRAYYSNMY